MAADREYIEERLRRARRLIGEAVGRAARPKRAEEEGEVPPIGGLLWVLGEEEVQHTVVVRDYAGRELSRFRGDRLLHVSRVDPLMGGAIHCVFSVRGGRASDLACSRAPADDLFERYVERARRGEEIAIYVRGHG